MFVVVSTVLKFGSPQSKWPNAVLIAKDVVKSPGLANTKKPPRALFSNKELIDEPPEINIPPLVS